MQWGGELTGSGKNSQLLGELNSEKIKLLNVSDAKLNAATSAVVVGAQSTPQKSTEMSVVASSAPAIVDVASITSGVSHAGTLDLVPALTVSAPASSIPPAVKAVTSMTPALAHAVKSVAKTCLEWGEFSGSDLERAGKVLAELKLQDRMGTRTVEYGSGFWVYIPPIANKVVLNKKIIEIKKIGVDDYFVMREAGKWNNAISLGVFKTEDAAKKYLLLIKKKGVRSATVGSRHHKLKFTVFTFNHVDVELSGRLNLVQKEFTNSELKTISCNN